MAIRPRESWHIEYPVNCVRYVEAFRRHFWDHAGVCKLLHNFFSSKGDVKSVCELGSGAGTNLMELSNLGYNCTGFDVSEESIAISRERADDSDKPPKFELLDFRHRLPPQKFDAVLSLFVPISLSDMAGLAHRAADMVKPGGYFAFMLLALQPEYRDILKTEQKSSEFLTVEDKHVLRMNFYQKNGHQIEYQGVYLIGDGANTSMAVDKDTYDLIEPDHYLDISPTLYCLAKRERIYGKPNQCPPMTFELLDIYQRL